MTTYDAVKLAALKLKAETGDNGTNDGEHEAAIELLGALGTYFAEEKRRDGATQELKMATRGLLWKLGHNSSAKGDGSDCKPGTVDRNDAAVRQLANAYKLAGGL